MKNKRSPFSEKTTEQINKVLDMGEELQHNIRSKSKMRNKKKGSNKMSLLEDQIKGFSVDSINQLIKLIKTKILTLTADLSTLHENLKLLCEHKWCIYNEYYGGQRFYCSNCGWGDEFGTNDLYLDDLKKNDPTFLKEICNNIAKKELVRIDYLFADNLDGKLRFTFESPSNDYAQYILKFFLRSFDPESWEVEGFIAKFKGESIYIKGRIDFKIKDNWPHLNEKIVIHPKYHKQYLKFLKKKD